MGTEPEAAHRRHAERGCIGAAPERRLLRADARVDEDARHQGDVGETLAIAAQRGTRLAAAVDITVDHPRQEAPRRRIEIVEGEKARLAARRGKRPRSDMRGGRTKTAGRRRLARSACRRVHASLDLRRGDAVAARLA